MSKDSDEAALEHEIADLEAKVAKARNELYALSQSYAASHFKVQTEGQALGVERLRRAGAESEVALLRQRCERLKRQIEQLRKVLVDLGVDPSVEQ